MSSRGGARQTLPDSRPAGKRGREPDSPDTPTSPPRSAGPLTRKRAASLRSEPRIEELSLDTPTTSSASSNRHPVEKVRERELICLCTPAPKVPRPRNAFILYRQHHQANVVAQNPGLANPEISKIIGERWRDETDENKEQWKRLAEEEKQRHQRQYPDYRYQPRRGGKGAAAAAAAANSRAQTPTEAGGDPGRCPKCGGRYIATPRTPGPGGSISSATPFPFSASTPGPGLSSSRAGSMATSSYGGGGGRGGDMERDRGPPPHRGSFAGGYGPPPPGYHVLGHQPHHLHGIAEDYEMNSPAEKKRRYDSFAEPQYDSRHGSYGGGGGGGGPYPYPYQHPYPPQMRGPPPPQQQQQPPPPPPQYARRASTSSGMPSPAYPPPPNSGPLPGPSLLGRGSVSANMAPPPRPGSVAYPAPVPQPGRRESGMPGGNFDESLRLPPLQTTSAPGNQQVLPPPLAHHQPSSQGHSPSSDHSTVGPTSHQRITTPGVESMIMSIPYLNKIKVLEKISPPLAPSDPNSPSHDTRGPVIAIEGPNRALVHQVGLIIERALSSSNECAVRSWSSSSSPSTPSTPTGGQDQRGPLKFSAYLKTIQEWHGKSEEIVRYITTSTTSSTPTPTTTQQEARRRSSDLEMSEDASSTKSAVSQKSDTPTSRPAPPPNQPQQSQLPVALLTDGFSLTLSDKFACRVPISDSYAPVDHWQWMATLWRGIVGPDLVVYVRSAEEEEMRDGRLQAVEPKGDGVMMVRVVGGAGPAGSVVVGEKVERRLGFEVVEWVRSGSFKEGF